jgi:sortase A
LAGTLKTAQWIFIVLGVVLVGIFVAAIVHREMGSRSDMEAFEEAKRARANATPAVLAPVPTPEPTKAPLPTDFPVDTELWAKGRIAKYEESLEHEFNAPLAILRIPKIDLEVAVLEGTDDLTLNRAVGWIEGTATLETMGNMGIAGHRDGYFRRLKDVVVGDEIQLETLDGTMTFVIEDISIVLPSDVHVLNPTEQPTVTLVGCYPFYYVGKAPKRYIVRAVLLEGPVARG